MRKRHEKYYSEFPDGNTHVRAESLRIADRCDPQDLLVDYPMEDIGGGFKLQREGCGVCTVEKGSSEGLLVMAKKITHTRTAHLLKQCESIVKFTEEQYNPLKCGTISLGHPSLYRGEHLPAEATLSSALIDQDEGIVRHPKNYILVKSDGSKFGTGVHLKILKEEDTIGLKLRDNESIMASNNFDLFRKIDNHLLYCLSMTGKNEDMSLNNPLVRRFVAEGYHSTMRVPYRYAWRRGIEIGLSFGLNRLRDGKCVVPLRADISKGDFPTVLVVHGPVLYVDDRDQWIHDNTTAWTEGVSIDSLPLIGNFVKHSRHSVEREYRYCILVPGKIKEAQIITPIKIEPKILHWIKWSTNRDVPPKKVVRERSRRGRKRSSQKKSRGVRQKAGRKGAEERES